MARKGWTVAGRKVQDRHVEPAPDQASACQRLRQDRPEGAGAGLHAAGVQIVSTGTTAALIAAAGVPVTGRRADRLPGEPRRPGEDAAPQGARRPARRHRHSRHVRQLEELGIEAFDLVVSNLYPFEETAPPGAAPEQWSSRSTSAAPRWCARRRRTTPRSLSSSPRPATPTCSTRWPTAASPWSSAGAGRRGVRAHRGVRHRGRVLVRLRVRAGRTARDAGWPRVAGARWQRAEVLRYGENPHQRARFVSRRTGG